MVKVLFILFFLVVGINANAQTHPETIAMVIANRMKDSLNLTELQGHHIYRINMQLHQKKTQMRHLHKGKDSLGKMIQRVENTRDSLYQKVLPEGVFLEYKSKKGTLIRGL